MKKKLLSILLSLAMVITMMPVMALTAFATDNNSQSAVVMLKATASGNNAVKKIGKTKLAANKFYKFKVVAYIG